MKRLLSRSGVALWGVIFLLTGIPAFAQTTQPTYLDDRSSPESLMYSFVSAINLKEYVRAYTYWDIIGGSQPKELASYDTFEQGYANTQSVQIVLGTITGDAGAGQLYYRVPVTLVAQTKDGKRQTYIGCYTLHLSQPSIQGVPPFRPLAITTATTKQVANNADTRSMMAQACPDASPPPPGTATPTPDPADITAAHYLDNRSGPEEVLRSLFNAVNRREYVRAYSYWEPNAPKLAPFDTFEKGYENTQSVMVTFGTITNGFGAGQIYYSVPLTLVAQTADGKTQTFVGCYTLHLAQPSIQGKPPFQPLAIASAKTSIVANNADTSSLMAKICPQA